MCTPQFLISSVSDIISTLVPSFPVDKPSRFSLDTSGVIGLVGGDDVVSTMAVVHFHGNGRWLGWYNNPGSFQIAKRLASFAESSSVFNIFGFGLSVKPSSKSVHADPAALLGVDNSCKGPKFRAAHSGTVIEKTGYLAGLFMKECTSWGAEGKVVPGRTTQPVGITVIDLGQAPPSEFFPPCSNAFTLLSASIPIGTSIAACALCAVCEDWYASSLILIGIVASGASSLVLGSAKLVFNHPEPAKGSPAGDGILSSNNDIVLVRGTEGAVNSIIRGTFSLRFTSQAHYSLVRWCSFLFLAQALAQLLLIPQASLFGQIMFLISLGVSGLYKSWISGDKDKIHRKLLFERVLENPTLSKYMLGTRTTAVVFMLLVLQLQDPSALLDEFLPNDTKVWKQWKATILEGLRHPNEKSFPPVKESVGLTQQEKDLIQTLYGDARAAYDGYMDYLRVDSI